MRIMEKYNDLVKSIRRIAFDSFYYKNVFKNADQLIQRVSFEYQCFDVNHISTTDKTKMFEFYHKLIKFFDDNKSDLSIISGDFINEKAHLEEALTYVKQMVILDVFVTGSSLRLDLEAFSKSTLENFKDLTEEELKELYDIYYKMYWFNTGIRHEHSDELYLPEFMFSEIA